MEAARDIAIIVLVVQGLIIGLAAFVAGVLGAIAIVEATVNVRRGLRRSAAKMERTNKRVDSIIETRVLPPIIQYHRGRAAARSTLEQARRALDDLKRTAGVGGG
ncbi:MAG: hypothetical protein OXO54_07015 [Chloroflexota bacterium]|nr:hypothetical protein [Chloroflexota bacterium]MDE2898055.1 hypothetical protein [Chloroflexota bacterium]